MFESIVDFDFLLIFLAIPAGVGASFATVAGLLRRRYGPWALLGTTLVGICLSLVLFKSLHSLDAAFAIPAIPGVLVAAAVLEWRARRAAYSELWRHVLWGTAAFVLGAVWPLGLVIAAVGSLAH